MNKKLIVSIFFVSFFLCSAGQNASAHATPITYEPESSVVLQKTPDRVRIDFSERIEPAASVIRVLGPDGSHAETGNARTDPADPHFYEIAMKDAGAGTYTVVWQVVSADDGHFIKGAFVFSVGNESAAKKNASGQIQINHITTIPEAATIWLELFGQSLLLGSLLVIVGIRKPLRRRFHDAMTPEDAFLFERGVAWIVAAGAVFIIAGVVSVLVLKTLDLEQLRSTSFLATLNIFARTLNGSHAIARGMLGILSMLVFFLGRRNIFKHEWISKQEKIFAALIFLMAFSRARVSHSAATNFFPRLSILITTFHLIAKELWIGGLVVLTVVLIPVLRRLKSPVPAVFSLTLFSRIISIIFGITGITGCYIVWLDLKNPAYLFSAEWGGRFIMLSLLGGILLFIRLYHQLIVEKTAARLSRTPESQKTPRTITWLPATLCLEMWVGIVLLSVTSFLIITAPPFPPEQFSFERHAASQGARIDFTVHPYEQKDFLVTITDEKTGAALPLSDIVIKLTNQEKGIGPIVAQTEKRFPGGYVFSRSTLSLSGKWRIAISAERPKAFDETASFEVDYPKEIDASRIDPEQRSFGWFELFLLLAAVGIGILAAALFRFSANLLNNIISSHTERSEVSHALLPDEILRELSYPQNDYRVSLWNGFKTWSFGVLGSLLIFSGVWFFCSTVLETDFRRVCERDNGFWLQSVPMRDGVALSSDTITGCTLNLGLYHFVDEREYAYFVRPRQSAVRVVTAPGMPIAGILTRLTATISAVEQGKIAGPIEDLGIYHDRILHMIIIGEDLKIFAHIHVEDLGPVTPEMKKTGVFPLQYTFPKAGHYTIVVNYIQGGRELSQQSFVEVGGGPKMEKYTPPADGSDQVTTKDFDGYHVTLEKPDKLKSGAVQKITYTIEKDSRPVTDLEPYLGAAMHLAVARADLGRVIHTHGQVYLPGSAFFQQLFQNYVNYHSHFVPDHFGPKIQTQITFPQPGLYRLFGEFNVGGKVVLTSFMVMAE